MAYVDPRELYRKMAASAQGLNYNTGTTAQNSTQANVPTGPDGGPVQPPPANGGSDFWNQFLAKIKPYTKQYDLISSSYDKLAPLLQQAQQDWGAEGILKYLDYNPLKGNYSVLSYLNGTPYYDKSSDGSYKAFYIPGFDYDPNTPGIQAPSWAGTPYAEGMHAYRT